MSHHKERTEKNCLNCNTEVVGKFCHACGQQNVEPKETFPSLLRHFLEDLTHFDGKFFKTIIQLFTKPGFLASEYIKGRRASYLNPIRFYIFVSAFFFLLLTGVFMHMGSASPEKKEKSSLGAAMIDLGNELQTADTSIVNDPSYKSIPQYDSAQASLPEAERDGAFIRYLSRKTISGSNYSAANKEESNEKLKKGFFRALPYALFISLPIVALILQLLYWRRKEHYYVSHIIFMVYMYCFVFLMLLLSMTLMKFGTPGYYMATALRLSIFVYLFLAMRRFYAQGFGKTFIKFSVFSILAMIIILIVSFIVAINAYLNLGS